MTVMLKDRKAQALSSFSYNYDLLRRHGVSQSHLRTRIFNPLKFPKVKISDDHKASCEKHARLMSASDLEGVNNKILDFLDRYNVNNDKVVQLFDMDEPKMRALESRVLAELSANVNNGMAAHYPDFPPQVSHVADKLLPVKKIDVPGGDKAFLLGSRRDYYKVFHLRQEDIREGVLSQVAEVKEVSAKGLVSEIALDVLYFDYANSRIELRLSNAVNMSGNNLRRFQNKFLAYVNGLHGGSVGNPFDFLPMISSLYFANDNGRITRFDFLTEEGVERNEKARKKKDDIKSENYHIGGAEKVKHIFQGFGIRKNWDFVVEDFDYSISLMIKGTASLLRKPGQTIDQVYLLDCFGYGDYTFLISKLSP